MIANRDGVRNAFQAQPVTLQRVEPEEVRLASGGQDEIVVGDRAVARLQAMRVQIDPRDLHQAKIEILLAAEDRARRLRDLLGLEARGRDLIQEGLEQVVIVAIDEHDVHRSASQRAGDAQTSESGTNHNDGG